MVTRWRALTTVLVAACVGLAGCSTESSRGLQQPSGARARTTATNLPSDGQAGNRRDDAVAIRVDTQDVGAEISPLILGVSGDLDADEMAQLGVTLESWGGNPASRFNYRLGNAWNAGSDWEFRNTDYGFEGNVFERFLDRTATAGVEARAVVPTLGWVARDGDESTCSFPEGDGCLGGDDLDCEHPRRVADPETTSVPSTPESVAAWIEDVRSRHELRFIAMDNEPELWGHTHFDIHPECPTYEEILDRYVTYATAIREVAPDAELMGPVMCCWFDYWRIAPGPADGSGADFLPWFLQQVRAHEAATGTRLLDVVDVHFYPQTGVFNDDTDEETNARRLRSTRALWDPSYLDESWIGEPIAFIPRLRDVIEQTAPGLPLFISEWNFGADHSMNGALAIAEVLGIYGREGVYGAAYWRSPEFGSPGALAFAMHGNYDGAGSRFAGRTVPTRSPDPNRVSAYGALDGATLRVMVLNKDPDRDIPVDLVVDGAPATGEVRRFTLAGQDPTRIVADQVELSSLTVPAYSITVLEVVSDPSTGSARP